MPAPAASMTMPPLGDGSTVEQRTLTASLELADRSYADVRTAPDYLKSIVSSAMTSSSNPVVLNTRTVARLAPANWFRSTSASGVGRLTAIVSQASLLSGFTWTVYVTPETGCIPASSLIFKGRRLAEAFPARASPNFAPAAGPGGFGPLS